jgi:ribose transport system substrate-binding protein
MKKLKLLLSLIMEENAYQKLLAANARDAAQRLGIDLEILFAGNDAVTQSTQLLDAIQSSSKDSRPDGIICAPVGTTLLQVARQAVAAGIGWALLERECDYLAELRSSYRVPIFGVTPNQEEVGRIQGRQIAALLPEGGLILHILGPTMSSVVKMRSSGMQLMKPNNVEVRTLIGNWSEQSGYKAVSRWLQLSTSRATPLSMVAAQNDDMALGARKAFETETRGGERERWVGLPYIGCDGCPTAGQEWVRKGLLTATVAVPSTSDVAIEIMTHAIQAHTQPQEHNIISPVPYPETERLKASVHQMIRSA